MSDVYPCQFSRRYHLQQESYEGGGRSFLPILVKNNENQVFRAERPLWVYSNLKSQTRVCYPVSLFLTKILLGLKPLKINKMISM